MVYSDVFAKLLNAFETLAVVAFDSHAAADDDRIFSRFALMFERLPVDQQPRAEDLIRRSLSALGEHVLTAELNSILSDLAGQLHAAECRSYGREVTSARERLAASVGKLGSRATRVSAGG